MTRSVSSAWMLCAALLAAGCAVQKEEDRARDDRLVSIFRASKGTPYQFKAKEVIYDYNQVRRALLVRRDYMLSDEEIRNNLKQLENELQKAAAWPFEPERHGLPRTSAAPEIDGDCSEAAWEKALAFRGAFPAGGTERRNDSSVWKLMYDENHLYFAAEFPDSDLQRGEPGRPFYGDSFELFILPEKRYCTYVELVFSPWNERHTKWVHQTPRGRAEITDYSPDSLLVRTEIMPGGWRLEGRIAFGELPSYLRGGPPQSGETLHVMMVRIDRNQPEERTLFVPVPFLPDGHNIYGYMKLTLE